MLSDLIQSRKPKTVLLEFVHGLGDVLQAVPVLEAIRKTWPEITFCLGIEDRIGFQDIIGRDLMGGVECVVLNDQNRKRFDLLFKWHWPGNEPRTDVTKAELSCRNDLGIPAPARDHPVIFPIRSPLIAVHFHSTCLPGLLGAKEPQARQVWLAIEETRRFIPIETHFLHKNFNLKNGCFPFVDRHVRSLGNLPIRSLLGLLQSCSGFIGVNSGNFHAALSILPPERIMYLETAWPAGCYTRLPVRTCKLNGNLNVKETVAQWLRTL